MAEPRKDLLLVRNQYPGYAITDSHLAIKTDALATCVAVGGVTNESDPKLFISHTMDSQHSTQVENLRRMGLSELGGDMFLFARSPRTMKSGLYTVKPDGHSAMNYGDAIGKLADLLASQFKKFRLQTLHYADTRFPPFSSFAEISILEGIARTDSGSIRFS